MVKNFKGFKGLDDTWVPVVDCFILITAFYVYCSNEQNYMPFLLGYVMMKKKPIKIIRKEKSQQWGMKKRRVIQKEKGKKQKINQLSDLNGMSTHLGLFHVYRLGNHVHCRFMCNCLSWVFFVHGPIKYD